MVPLGRRAGTRGSPSQPRGPCTPMVAACRRTTREAVRWNRLAAEQGLAAAQFNLGVMYHAGAGVPQDAAEAVRWYRLAAAQGHAEAQVSLGVMYADGRGVPEDDAEAVRWFRLATEQGSANAQHNLGAMYDNGEGVAQDDAQAARWYRLAAEQGFTDAQFSLGVMYADGRGVPEDDAEAVRWYRLAAEQGLAGAQLNLGFMYSNGEGVTAGLHRSCPVVPPRRRPEPRLRAIQPRNRIHQRRRCPTGQRRSPYVVEPRRLPIIRRGSRAGSGCARARSRAHDASRLERGATPRAGVARDASGTVTKILCGTG